LYTTVFQWDPKKSASNRRKHGIRFADAVSVLEDERAVTVADDSVDEERFVSIRHGRGASRPVGRPGMKRDQYEVNL
jgi:uncharacterized DUF497 family protein